MKNILKVLAFAVLSLFVCTVALADDTVEVPTPLFSIGSSYICAVSTNGNRLLFKTNGQLTEMNQQQAQKRSKKRQAQLRRKVSRLNARKEEASGKKRKNLARKVRAAKADARVEKKARKEISSCLENKLLPSVRQPLSSGSGTFNGGSAGFQFFSGDLLFHNFPNTKGSSAQLRASVITSGTAPTFSGFFDLSIPTTDPAFGSRDLTIEIGLRAESAFFDDLSKESSPVTGTVEFEFDIPNININLVGEFKGQPILGTFVASIPAAASSNVVGDTDGDGDVDFDDYSRIFERCFAPRDVNFDEPCTDIDGSIILGNPALATPIFVDGFESGNTTAWSSNR